RRRPATDRSRPIAAGPDRRADARGRRSGGRGQPLRVPAVVMPTYRDGEVWSVRDGQLIIEPQPVLRLSSLLTVRDAAGAGAALLPQSLIANLLEKGELASWGMADGEVELWVLHTARRLQSPKVRAFVAFMCGQYPNGIFTLLGR
ncbi:LysR substrate-binding domain-containing protein, partial [Acerihabitans sp.]|uniref:LysR substrate-binding domain-containing protein n=1 Tax=Acerihabitans sp. TaxID=2811394 RepID=UPI002ED79AF5